jgi:hypothetical protein
MTKKGDKINVLDLSEKDRVTYRRGLLTRGLAQLIVRRHIGAEAACDAAGIT